MQIPPFSHPHPIRKLLSAVSGLPSQCLLCKAPTRGKPLCIDCHATFPWNARCCQYCALPLEADSGPCSECMDSRPIVSETTCVFQYKAPCNTLLNRFKHDGQLEYGHLLAGFLADTLIQKRESEQAPWPDALLPVPLHWRRLRGRGFNQSLEIAKVLSRRLGLPICHHLRRQLPTTSQQQLRRSERQNNLEDAFALAQPIPYRHVALVDDVMTTGSTVNAIARHLIAHGVLSIRVWAIARTPQQMPTLQS